MTNRELRQRVDDLEQTQTRLNFTLQNREREIAKLKEREGYEQALELSAAVLAALCTRSAAGGTVRLAKDDVRTALGRYVFAAVEDADDYVLSFRERELSQ